MEQLKNFTMDKVYQKIFLPDNEFDQWLVQLGLLHTTMICECGNLMIVRKPKNGERYGRWRCNISKCRKEKSFLAGTFFSGSHVTTKKVFAMAYWWAMKFGGEEDWVREFGVASHTVVDWRNSFRDVCAQYLEKTNDIKKEIEETGDGELEEPVPVKRKYNKGEPNKEVWLYGGECLWRKKFGSRNEIFYNFWLHVSHIFPCYRVTE